MVNMEPARLSLLNPAPARFKLIGRVKVLDSFQNNSRDFHEDGLFSTTIFGPVGAEQRLTRFGYMALNAPILHPRVFNHICTLKTLYKGILAGREYAIWSESEKDFIKADQMTGQTGYHFFISKLPEIKFKQTGSKQRKGKITLITENMDKALTSHLVVMPAGYRELEVDDDGDTEQHEINDLYRNILRIANNLANVTSTDSPIVDQARFYLQLAFNELHDFILGFTTKGKGAFINSKFGRRKQTYGTANVISVAATSVSHLDDPTNFMPNEIRVGTLQGIKATEPLFIHHLRRLVLNKVFTGETSAWLVNTKTMAREEVRLRTKAIDKWTTVDGLASLIESFKNIDMRNQYVMVEKSYLTMIYKRDGVVRLIHDYDEIPEELGEEAKSYITPITYGELFFYTLWSYGTAVPCDSTRYPTTGEGSIVPFMMHPLSSVNPLKMVMLGDDWQPTNLVTANFPNSEENEWFDVLSPHTIYLAGYGADFDGDVQSLIANMSKEAIGEVANYMESFAYHLDPEGGLIGDPLVDNVKRVCYNMTGDFEDAVEY